MEKEICVCGAGTMGYGIAQIAAQSGFWVILYDLQEAGLQHAKETVESNVNFLISKNKLTKEEGAAIGERLIYTTNIEDCKAPVIIEAIVEKEQAKIELFKKLAEINSSETIFATNTSSLSVSTIQEHIPHPERVAGMHFFNPAYIMKLVEVVRGRQTHANTTTVLMQLAVDMGRQPVLCKDAPGFIVNRTARHYYLESLKMAEEETASFEEIDQILESTGFKMGPFRLMDLIGMDINLAVSQSLYEAFDSAPRFKPSSLQEEKVKNNELGRKTGKGFYQYP